MHVADIIVAIGKMSKAKLTPAVIAGALGYAEVDVRRLMALAALHPKALEALKAGRVNLRQARLLARLPDPKEQAEIAEAAMSGYGFQEWRITDRLDAGQVTVRDRRFRLVGAERYGAAGGRIETDLFGERPDVVLDPEVLQGAWVTRAEALVQGLAAEGVPIAVSVAPAQIDDAALEPFGDAYGMGLDADGLAAWEAARSAEQTAEAALAGADWASDEAGGLLTAYLAAKLAADVAGEPEREVTFVQVFSDTATGVSLRAFGPPAPVIAADEDDVDEAEDGDDGVGAWSPRSGARGVSPPEAIPIAVAPRPELEGVGHSLHEVRTDTATRALIRALADDPGAALTALVARLFSVVVLYQGLGGGGALTIMASAYSKPRTTPIEALDGDVRRRLADRRAAWQASGLSPIAWVGGLAHGEKMGLLAEVVALSLDLREARTTSVRKAARAEAVEIAALCQADVTLHWTPDEAFLGAHPKAKLLDMLDDMGAGETRAGAAKKDELVSLVAERAAERGWAPAYLSWTAEPPQEPEDTELEPPTEDRAAGGDRPDDEDTLAAA